jgi:hypothetical protein
MNRVIDRNVPGADPAIIVLIRAGAHVLMDIAVVMIHGHVEIEPDRTSRDRLRGESGNRQSRQENGGSKDASAKPILHVYLPVRSPIL